MSQPILSLHIDPEAVELCSNIFEHEDGANHDPESHLSSTVEILETLHHLEFIEVHDIDGEQKAIIAGLEKKLDAAYEINGAAPFATVTYNNRSYVVLLTPFAA